MTNAAPYNPDNLKWVREMAGLQLGEVARKLGFLKPEGDACAQDILRAFKQGKRVLTRIQPSPSR